MTAFYLAQFSTLQPTAQLNWMHELDSILFVEPLSAFLAKPHALLRVLHMYAKLIDFAFLVRPHCSVAPSQ